MIKYNDPDIIEFSKVFKLNIIKYRVTRLKYMPIASSAPEQPLEKMKNLIGLGGTGSYVLDLIAKMPVEEIHLYDGDVFLQHNAFMAPGAPNISKLEKGYSKVECFKSIYSNMHNGIVGHNYNLDRGYLIELGDLDFDFILLIVAVQKNILLNI